MTTSTERPRLRKITDEKLLGIIEDADLQGRETTFAALRELQQNRAELAEARSVGHEAATEISMLREQNDGLLSLNAALRERTREALRRAEQPPAGDAVGLVEALEQTISSVSEMVGMLADNLSDSTEDMRARAYEALYESREALAAYRAAPREEPEAGADLRELQDRIQRWADSSQGTAENSMILDVFEAIVSALVGVARDAERGRR